MMTAGELKAILANCPDDYMPMVRIHSGELDPVDGQDFWTTSLRPADCTIEPGTHELRFTIIDYKEDW